jgi:xanthosine utilization system XapX-like protein
MAKFLDLLERSVLVQAISTLACVGVLLYLVATSQPVPPELSQLTWALLGVYLGSKIENAKLTRREMKG